MEMKLLVIVVLTIVFAITIGINHAEARCMLDKDWPGKPCIDTSPPLPLSKSEWKDLWTGYYIFKGADWMENKKSELDNQVKSGTLKEWIESGNEVQNFTNYNVWFYYYVNGQAPAPEGYELSEPVSSISSPLKQFKSGVPLDKIQCKEGLVFAIKSSDSSPICIKQNTLEILKQRGWLASTIPDTTPITTTTDLNEPAKNIVDANNQFMLDYYTVTNTKGDNSFFSPWSMLSAFSLLYEGARGQTADEISSVFYLPKDDSQRRDSFTVMQNNLNVNGSGYELRNANALWVQQGFGVKEDYINTAKQFYDSKVSEVNFPADEQIIDSWVEQKTNDKIQDLVKGKTNELTKLVITNAVYFKGTWQTQFEPDQTSESEFRVNEDKSVSTPLMYMQSKFPYAETSDLQIISIPYNGDKLSMLVLLPKDNLESLDKSLTLENLQNWKNNLQVQETKLFMPKFKIETTYELPKIMQSLGMKLAFDENKSDLSGIANTPPRLFVTDAVHKAFVDVNEEGTEAAAATGITVGVTSMGPEMPVFRADHPFVFLIQDNETGLILFMGKVVDPTK